MNLTFHTLNRLILGIVLIVMGVIFSATLVEWEYIFRYYGLGGWTTSRILARFVPVFLFCQASLILADRAKMWASILLFSVPLVFGFLMSLHSPDEPLFYTFDAFGSNTMVLITILIVAGLSFLQTIKKNAKSKTLDLIAVGGICISFTVGGLIWPMTGDDYANFSETLPADHFSAVDKVDENTLIVGMFTSECPHCHEAAQQLSVVLEEHHAYDRFVLFLPDNNSPEKFQKFAKTKAEHHLLEGGMFRDLNGKFVPGVYIRNDDGSFAAYRGGAFNLHALQHAENVLSD